MQSYLRFIVLFLLVFFTAISSADAKPRKKKQKRYHVQTSELSVMVTDITDEHITTSHNIDKVRALASMTKLMTAMVALDYDTNMDRKLTLSKMAGSKMPKREYTRGELFHMLLIKSDNAAAETLASDYPGGREKFMKSMNLRAMMLDMYGTHFDDPSGLSRMNVSTASDVTKMVIGASEYPQIRDEIMRRLSDIAKKDEVITIVHDVQ